jgi:hypothetical protein
MSDTTKQPCGCHDTLLNELGNSDPGSAEIPSLDELESKLQAISSASSAQDSTISEFDLAGLDASLAALDELSLDSMGDADTPTLTDLLRLLERFPGLKLSLSY